MRERLTVLALGVFALPMLGAATGCANACKRVETHRAAFTSGSDVARSEDPHFRVSVPFDVVGVLMARELKSIGSFRVPLPKVSGVSLGAVRGRVDQIRLQPAPTGQVGFTVRIVLESGKTRVLEVELDARTTPQIDLKRGTVAVALSAQDVRKVRPKLGPGARKKLVDYAWKELPSTVRTLVSKKQLDALLAGASDQLLGQVADAVRKDLGSEIGEVARFEIDLPDLPLSALAIESSAGELKLAGRTSLPVAVGVAAGKRHRSSHQNAVELRMSGETAAALANWAIERGEIPERYDLDGSPDPKGPLAAGVGWGRGRPRPLTLHLWTVPDGDLAKKKQCAHVELHGTPVIGVANGGDVSVSVRDGQVEAVDGTAKVRMGVFFSGLGRETFEFAETVAGSFELDLGDAPLTASVHSATRDGDDVVFGLLLRRGRDTRNTRPRR